MEDLLSTAFDQGNLIQIAEGKTKTIYEIKGHKDLVLIRSKDQLTAFNAVRKNQLEGKARIANRTTVNVFKFLNEIGIATHFVSSLGDCEFIARKCEMIPIEWVARRVATGSFLKRNVGVPEGYRFSAPKIETFFKDDANDDPQYSEEQIVCAGFQFNGVKITKAEIGVMKRMTLVIFKALERCWSQQSCALIDMKVEFGVTADGQIVLADVIDNDSWRVWPHGDRRLQLDKQFYRLASDFVSLNNGPFRKDCSPSICASFKEEVIHYSTVARWYQRFEAGDISLEDRPRSGRPSVVEEDSLREAFKAYFRDMKEVTPEALQMLISNYEKVMELTAGFSTPPRCRALIIMGSAADMEHCTRIATSCRSLGITPTLRISSAHKTTQEALDIVAEFEADETPTVVVAVAGRSNGLGPVVAGNSALPVINCPPLTDANLSSDIWSSLKMPSGLGCSTVYGPEEAALCAAKQMASHDHMVYGRILATQLNNAIKLAKADRATLEV